MISNYDGFAKTFAKSRDRHWPDLAELVAADAVQTRLDGSVADIGCGSGRLLDYIPIRTHRGAYYGYDLSGQMILEASRRYPGEIFVQQDMLDLSITPVKLVFFIASFHHITQTIEQERVLRAARECLLPGGVIALLNWNLTSQVLTERYPADKKQSSLRNIACAGYSRTYRAWGLDELTCFFEKREWQVMTAKITATGHNMIHIIRPKYPDPL